MERQGDKRNFNCTCTYGDINKRLIQLIIFVDKAMLRKALASSGVLQPGTVRVSYGADFRHKLSCNGIILDPLSVPARIAIFILAVVCTAGLGYAAYKTIAWAYHYIGSFDQNEPHPILRVVGPLVVIAIVALRIYVSRRAKAARAKKVQ